MMLPGIEGRSDPSRQATGARITVELLSPPSVQDDQDWRDFADRHGIATMYASRRFVYALADGLRQVPYRIEARCCSGRLVGALPLIHMKSALFGAHLVSLPYVSWGGAVADTPAIGRQLVDEAIELAERLDVDFLELRQLVPLNHDRLVEGATVKTQMRVPLHDREQVWSRLKSEVRTQIRKAQKSALAMRWGGDTLLDDFYDIFAHNMRDLGTPVFPQRMFVNLLAGLDEAAEIGVVDLQGKPVAACLVVHGPEESEIPSAASLRAYRSTAANSLMYWNAIGRALDRGQRVIDFGRSTPEAPTYVFKRKWGADPFRIPWLYHVRRGTSESLRPDVNRFRLARRAWQHLPVPVTRIIGPMIVRGIP